MLRGANEMEPRNNTATLKLPLIRTNSTIGSTHCNNRFQAHSSCLDADSTLVSRSAIHFFSQQSTCLTKNQGPPCFTSSARPAARWTTITKPDSACILHRRACNSPCVSRPSTNETYRERHVIVQGDMYHRCAEQRTLRHRIEDVEWATFRRSGYSREPGRAMTMKTEQTRQSSKTTRDCRRCSPLGRKTGGIDSRGVRTERLASEPCPAWHGPRSYTSYRFLASTRS